MNPRILASTVEHGRFLVLTYQDAEGNQLRRMLPLDSPEKFAVKAREFANKVEEAVRTGHIPRE